MATKKIVFFTATNIPTADEKAAIARLKELTIPAYELAVRNSQASMRFNGEASHETTDFVCGTPPIEYAELPVFDIDNLPA